MLSTKYKKKTKLIKKTVNLERKKKNNNITISAAAKRLTFCAACRWFNPRTNKNTIKDLELVNIIFNSKYRAESIALVELVEMSNMRAIKTQEISTDDVIFCGESKVRCRCQREMARRRGRAPLSPAKHRKQFCNNRYNAVLTIRLFELVLSCF